jgi:hypothetical protein
MSTPVGVVANHEKQKRKESKMAKQKINTDLIMCDGFWQPEKEGDKVHGVLLTMNMVVDKKKGGLRPLYVLASLEKDTKNVFLEKEAIEVPRGGIIGVNSAFKIDVAMRKLGGVARVCGHEIEIIYLGKTHIEKTGNDVKNYEITWDDQVNKEFKDKVVMPDPPIARASAQIAPEGEEIPF